MQARVLITAILVSFLLSCGQADQEPTGSSTSSGSSSTGVGNSDIIPSPIKSPEPSMPLESGTTIAETAQLAPNQVQDLMSFAQQTEQIQPGRKFRIIVPTYIPSGFQVEKVNLKVDDSLRAWSSYGISYKNSNSGECFSIGGSSGGWGAGDSKYQDTKVFSEALGIVALSILSSDRESDSPSISLRYAPIVRNERGYDFESNSYQGCSTMNFNDAVKVVESLQYMDSPQTKAKPLEGIRKDADLLTSKFEFPLGSCGDSSSGSNARWYPVFVDGTYLKRIQYEYCKDAVSKEKTQYSFEKVQVGSFTSYERASEFAKAVGGRVGKIDN